MHFSIATSKFYNPKSCESTATLYFEPTTLTLKLRFLSSPLGSWFYLMRAQTITREELMQAICSLSTKRSLEKPWYQATTFTQYLYRLCRIFSPKDDEPTIKAAILDVLEISEVFYEISS